MAFRDIEKKRAAARAWRAAHVEQARASARAWAAANPEKNAAAEKAWRAANQDKIRAARAAQYARDSAPKRARQQTRRTSAPMTAALIRGVTDQCDGLCSYCLQPGASIDHVLPVSRGGSNDPSNLVLACGPCNSRKGAKTPLEFAMGW